MSDAARLLLVGCIVLAAGTDRASDEGVAARGADPDLLDTVRQIALGVEEIRGETFQRKSEAVRADDSLREALAEVRVEALAERARLEARGRAWADVGLGNPGDPRRLMLLLARDLVGFSLAPDGRGLLVSPDRLTATDFEPRSLDEDAATVLLWTGVRPDEPGLSHMLVHLRQRERGVGDPLEGTTDRLLARTAWAEGEANLVAVRYLFKGMGLAEGATAGLLHPGMLLDGRLLPAGLAEETGVVGALARFVYLDGFDRAAERYRAGGWAALAQAVGSGTTTSSLLHVERVAAPSALPFVPSSIEGLGPVDEDSLGEQGIVTLVSWLTGKDNLALQAADGWAGDRLVRLEGAGGPAGGVTEWITRWRDRRSLEDFLYAYRRTLEARFPGHEIQRSEEGRESLDAAGRRHRIVTSGLEVRITVSPAHPP